MPRALTIAVLLAAAQAAAGVARADSDCWVPITEWQPRSAVEALAQSHGWTMRRIRIDDGCYEMEGATADGKPIEVLLHPHTLQILEVHRLDGKDEDRAKEGEASPGGTGDGG